MTDKKKDPPPKKADVPTGLDGFQRASDRPENPLQLENEVLRARIVELEEMLDIFSTKYNQAFYDFNALREAVRQFDDSKWRYDSLSDDARIKWKALRKLANESGASPTVNTGKDDNCESTPHESGGGEDRGEGQPVDEGASSSRPAALLYVKDWVPWIQTGDDDIFPSSFRKLTDSPEDAPYNRAYEAAKAAGEVPDGLYELVAVECWKCYGSGIMQRTVDPESEARCEDCDGTGKHHELRRKEE